MTQEAQVRRQWIAFCARGPDWTPRPSSRPGLPHKTTVSDPDPHGTLLQWLPLIRIRIRIQNANSGSGSNSYQYNKILKVIIFLKKFLLL